MVFIYQIIFVFRSLLHRRPKRSAECSVSPNECCRESLYVSFAEIGWDDWIIRPEGYNAYFCRGSCNTPMAIMNSASHHNSILQVNISNISKFIEITENLHM